MDNITLFTDFQKHVNAMTDDDILESISKAVNDTILDDFIAFSKDEYGMTVEAVESDTPDSFEKIFEI